MEQNAKIFSLSAALHGFVHAKWSGVSRCTMISGTKKKKNEEKGEADRSLDVKKEA